MRIQNWNHFVRLIQSRYSYYVWRLKQFLHPPRKGDIVPRLFYGHTRVPQVTDKTTGGIIKIQSLDQVFPNQPVRYNLMYVTSSALPKRFDEIHRYTRAKNIPLIWNQNGVAYPAWKPEGWEQLNQRLSRFMHDARHVIYQSQFCKRCADVFLGEFRGSWEVVHNPVDTKRYSPPSSPLPPYPLVLLAAGTQHSVARLEILLAVIKELIGQGMDVRLTIPGGCRWMHDTHACQTEARRIIRQFCLEKVVDLGNGYTQEEAPFLFRNAHILLHPQYNDACPTSVLEAMACGLPVVYTRSGGTPELVGTEGGVGIEIEESFERIPVIDPYPLAQAVMKVFADLEKYSTAARNRMVKHFDLKIWLDHHHQLFQKILQER